MAIMGTRRLFLVSIIIVGIAWSLSVIAQSDAISLSHPAIQYSRPSNDPVGVLLRRPDGISRLTSEGPSGYLRAILNTLDVPVSSQIMVFSKGSVQSTIIAANNPRGRVIRRDGRSDSSISAGVCCDIRAAT